jgi:glycosyltransferase involved in cell wall biosynthesis
LISGRLSSYKNFDIVVKLFTKLNKNLIVIGTGNEENYLRELAGPTIKFLGKVSDEILDEYLWKSKGYIFPVVEEDFGIALVEALNHGNPVLCHNSGGPKEIMRDGIDGIFFQNLDLEDFEKKFHQFEAKINNHEFNRREISQYAQRFDEKIFSEKFSLFVSNKWREFYEQKTKKTSTK